MELKDYKAYYGNDFIISLDELEIKRAAYIGKQIWLWSQQQGLIDYVGNKPNGVSGARIQQLGCIAQSAIAKAANIYDPSTFCTYQNSDLAHNIEVRLIGVDHYGLKVRPTDDDSKRVVGIVIEKGKEEEPYRIPGWILAKDGKQPQWLINPYDGRPFYAVPQDKLRSFDELISIINNERIRMAA